MKESIDSILEKILKFGETLIKLTILAFIVLIFLPISDLYPLATGIGLVLLFIYFIGFFNGLYFINKIVNTREISNGFKLIGVSIILSVILIAYVGYYSLVTTVLFDIGSTIIYVGIIISVLVSLGFIFIGLGLRKLGLNNKIDKITLAGNLLIILVTVELILSIADLIISNSSSGIMLGTQIILSLITIIVFYELGMGFKELHKKLVELTSKKELISELEEKVKQVSSEKLYSLAKERDLPLILLQIIKYTT